MTESTHGAIPDHNESVTGQDHERGASSLQQTESMVSVDPVRAEVQSLLEADRSRLGDVYRLDRDGHSPAEIADALSLSTTGFVSNYKAVINALTDCTVPGSPTMSGQVAARVRTWLKKPGLSDDLRHRLEELHTDLQHRAEDSVARSVENDRTLERTQQAEEASTPGIYVYTLPHYLRYPYDPDSGRTLLKVGRSERDTYDRAYSQGRITALPEDPILLRVYAVADGGTATVERDFHAWLEDADHDRSRSLRGGTEWFVTSTKFLDRVARVKGLQITVVSEFEVSD